MIIALIYLLSVLLNAAVASSICILTRSFSPPRCVLAVNCSASVFFFFSSSSEEEVLEGDVDVQVTCCIQQQQQKIHTYAFSYQFQALSQFWSLYIRLAVAYFWSELSWIRWTLVGYCIDKERDSNRRGGGSKDYSRQTVSLSWALLCSAEFKLGYHRRKKNRQDCLCIVLSGSLSLSLFILYFCFSICFAL